MEGSREWIQQRVGSLLLARMCKVTWSLFLHFLVFATSYEFNAVYRTNQYEVAHYYEKDLYEIPWNCLFSPMHATLYNILTCSYCDNITICIAIDVL